MTHISPVRREDEIYNLACPASPVHYQFDPVQTTKTSVHGAINMLGLAKRVKAKILQASTSEVYGDPKMHPQTEDYRNVIKSPPGLLRRRQALRGNAVFRLSPPALILKSRWCGYSIPMGRACTRMTGASFRTLSCRRLTGASQTTVFGDGLQTRSFCYVDDMVGAMLDFMQTPSGQTAPSIWGTHVNLQ